MLRRKVILRKESSVMKSILLVFFFFLSVGLAADEGAAKLNGYCPVAYVEMGKAIKGEAKFASANNGSKWLFVNSDAKSMFEKDQKSMTDKAIANWTKAKENANNLN